MQLSKWIPNNFVDGAEDPKKAVEAFNKIIALIDLAVTSNDFESLSSAMGSYFRDAQPFVMAQAILRDTWPSERYSKHAVLVDGPLFELTSAFTRLLRAYEDSLLANPARADSRVLRDFAKYVESTKQFKPSAQVEAWKNLAHSTGFQALDSLHDAIMKKGVMGTIEHNGQSLEVTNVNLVELSRHSDQNVRKQSYVISSAFALKHTSELEIIKRSRGRFGASGARLLGHKSIFSQFLTESRLSENAVSAIKAQKPRVKQFYAKFIPWLRSQLSVTEFFDSDLNAPLKGTELVKTDLSSLVLTLKDSSARYCPAYPEIIDEMFERQAVLSNPENALSGGFYMVPNLSGGTPFLHAPYRNDLFSFEVFAHEMGHACHIAHSVRSQGPLSAFSYSVSFVEIFSSLFEIMAKNHAFNSASGASAKKIWAHSIVTQFLHFFSNLASSAEFDEVFYNGLDMPREELSAAFRDIHYREKLPTFVKPACSVEDRSWLLNIFQETMPFYGYEYAIAFGVAYHIYLNVTDVEAIQVFANECSFMPLSEAARTYLGLDIEDPACYDFAWRHIDALFEAAAREETETSAT